MNHTKTIVALLLFAPMLPTASIAVGEESVKQADYSVLVTCFHGPVDSQTFCSKKVSGHRTEVESGDLTCKYTEKASKISWTCVKAGKLGDLYTFTRVFPAGADGSKTFKKQFYYQGNKRVVVFEDDVHAIVIEHPKPMGKQTAEQGGADQPATRSKSKSEGNEKTKPEAEGRSQ